MPPPAASDSAVSTRSGVIGSCVRWIPTASAIALAIAGAGGPIGGSPIPRAPERAFPEMALEDDRADVGDVE